MARGPLGFISYELENDRAIEVSIADAFKRVGNLKVPFTRIVKDFRESNKAIFGLKGPGQYPNFQGPKIKDKRVAPSKNPNRSIPKTYDNYTYYQYRKEKDFRLQGGYPLLKRTGRLEKSLVDRNADSIEFMTDRALYLGTQVEYGIYHQSDDPRSQLPQRKFLFIGPESVKFARDKKLTGRLDRWLKIINNYVKRELDNKPQGGGE